MIIYLLRIKVVSIGAIKKHESLKIGECMNMMVKKFVYTFLEKIFQEI